MERSIQLLMREGEKFRKGDTHLRHTGLGSHQVVREGREDRAVGRVGGIFRL